MFRFPKEDVLRVAQDKLGAIYDLLAASPKVQLSDIEGEAALLVVDMINGFVREGALQSPRVERLIPKIRQLMQDAHDRQLPIVAFADSHPEDSPESFLIQPIVCREQARVKLLRNSLQPHLSL